MTSPFIHPQALCDSDKIGVNTMIWAFSHILPGATIGADCDICEGVFVENDVYIGDRVTIKNGAQLWDGVTIEDDVFIGPNVTFVNDRMPRSRKKLSEYPKTTVRKGASVGASATILPGVVIGESAMIGAGSVVTRNVPPYAIAVGNPARITGYVNSLEPVEAEAASATAADQRVEQTKIDGVTLHHFDHVNDLRGDLTVGEFDRDIPFQAKRYFLVFDVPNEKTRGQHAHKECHQFLICVKGRCSVVADDGTARQEFLLDNPSLGLYLPPMTWGTQYKYSSDAVLLVFASHYYAASDYIRDYDDFIEAKLAQGVPEIGTSSSS